MVRAASTTNLRRAGRNAIVTRWVTWLVVLAAATLLMFLVRGMLDKAHVTLVFLLVVLGASAAGGRALGLTVAALAFLCFDFFFLLPYYTLTISNPLDWLVLFAFLITSAVAAQLLHRANATAEAATQRAQEVDRLAALGAETLNAADADDALRAIADVIRTSVGVDECDIYHRLPDGRAAPIARASAGEGTIALELSDIRGGRGSREDRIAQPGSLVDWIVERGTSAVELEDGTVRVARDLPVSTDASRHEPQTDIGTALAMVTRHDNTSASARVRDALGLSEELPTRHLHPAICALALPLQVRDHTVGVLRIAKRGGLELAPEQVRLLGALSYYAALGVERARLVAAAERAEAERRLEKLRSALLTAVSHDLRTPLTTIKGIASEIVRGGEPQRAVVIETEADRLDALVGDLLDLSRIQAGAVLPALSLNTIDDLIGAALRRAAGALGDRRVDIDAPAGELLAGHFDFTQTLRILVNLLDNASKYSPSGSPVEVHVRKQEDRLRIDVMDRGPGVPVSERERIFEPFYRPPDVPPDIRGTGLGLSIARGLAEAQGGSLQFSPRAGGGSVFTLELRGMDASAPDSPKVQGVEPI
jgi:two-component system, OmpR family, sensor histidine kinase KdpD